MVMAILFFTQKNVKQRRQSIPFLLFKATSSFKKCRKSDRNDHFSKMKCRVIFNEERTRAIEFVSF